MSDIFRTGFEMDTSDLKKGDVALEELAKSADKTDKSLENLNKEMKTTSSTAKGAKKGVDTLNASIKQTKKGSGLAKNSAQQLGYQLQDVAVQAQMGVSPFTILGQQGSQLASVFGSKGALLGAVIAIGSALGGVLYKALGKVKLEAKDVKEEILELTENFKDLTKAQREAVAIALGEEIKDQKDKLNEYTQAITKNESEITRLKNSIRAYKKEITVNTPEATNILFRNRIEDAQNKITDLRKNVALLRGQWDTEFQRISGTTEDFAEVTKNSLDAITQSTLDSIKITGKVEQEKWQAIQSGIREREKELAILNKIELSTNSILANEMQSKENAIAKGKAQQEVAKNTRLAGFESQLSELETFGKSEAELENKRYRESLELLREYAEEKGWLQSKIKENELLLESDHQAKLLEIEKSGMEERAKNSMSIVDGAQHLASMQNDIVTITTANRKAQLQADLQNSEKFSAAQLAAKDKELRAIFEKEKSANKNRVIINTAVAVSENLNNPFAAGAAFLGGMAQLATIEATKYSGSTSPTAPNTAPASQNTTNNNSGGNIVNLNISNTGGGAIDVEAIQQYLKDGGVLFDADTEQAGALR